MLQTDEVAADIWLFASDENVAAGVAAIAVADGDLIDYAANDDADAEFGKIRSCDEDKWALNIECDEKEVMTSTMPMK